MPIDEATICNMALARIGVGELLKSSDGTLAGRNDTTLGGDKAEFFYPLVRDQVLQDFPWQFARRYATLDLITLGTGLPWEDQWLYAYQLPDDMLVLRRFLTTPPNTDSPMEPFEIGSDANGRVIYTNFNEAAPTATPSARIEYTALLTDAGYFDPKFADAVAWKLAAELRQPLQVAPELRVNDERMYAVVLSSAERATVNEQEPGESPDGRYVEARGG